MLDRSEVFMLNYNDVTHYIHIFLQNIQQSAGYKNIAPHVSFSSSKDGLLE